MTQKSKSILYNPYAIAIIGGVIVVLIIRFVDSIFGTEFITYAWDMIVKLFSYFTISFEIPIWGIILIFLSPILCLFSLILIINGLNSDKGEEDVLKPIFDFYKEDNFEGKLYRWDYSFTYDNKYIIKNLVIHCSECKCRVINRKCPNCGVYVKGEIKKDSVIETLIGYRLEKKMDEILKSSSN